MRSLVRTARRYVHGLATKRDGVDLLDVQTTLTDALEVRWVVRDWQIRIVEAIVEAEDSDFAAVETLDRRPS